MTNRYVRDELIHTALQMVQLPNLEIHDMPDGVVLQNAYCIQWLQDILDFWHHMVPFSSTVRKAPLNATANSDTILLPQDFILDVRNGYIVQRIPGNSQSFARRYRVPLQKFINRQLGAQSQQPQVIPFPNYYCISGDDDIVTSQRQTMLITPTPTIATQGYLWYYQLPAALEAAQKPRCPNDYVCIEYLRIRACEWAGLYEPGTAQKFCQAIIASMKANGLMNEPEDDEIPFDEQVYHKGIDVEMSTFGWMGAR
jgi:hypothetical protein